jgi:hypothetical protein
MAPHISTIREKILSILELELGQYTFTNGQSVPALSVDDGQFPPSGTVITGLECVIVPLNNAVTTRLCGSKQITYQSDILLKQWDLDSNVICAVEKLTAGLPEIATIGPRLLANGNLSSIEQQRITIETNEIIRWR